MPGSSSASTRSRGSSLPRAVCLVARGVAAAERGLGGLGAQVVDQRAHRVGVGPELGRARVDLGLQGLHVCLLGFVVQFRVCSDASVALVPRLPAADADADAAQQPVGQAVDEAVHLDALAAVPGAPQDGRPADVGHLLDRRSARPAGAPRSSSSVAAAAAPHACCAMSSMCRSQLSASPTERCSATACTPPQP